MKFLPIYHSRVGSAFPFFFLVMLLTFIVFPGIGNSDVMSMYVDAARQARNPWWSLSLEVLWSGALYLGFIHYGWFYFVSNLMIATGGSLIVYGTGAKGKVLLFASTLLIFCPPFLLYLCRFVRGGGAMGAVLCAIALGYLGREAKAARARRGLFAGSLFFIVLATVYRIDFIGAVMPLALLFASKNLSIIRKVLSLALWSLIIVCLVFGFDFGVKAVYGVGSSTGAKHSMHLDLVGMSYHAGRNLYSPELQNECSAVIKQSLKDYQQKGVAPFWSWFDQKRECRAEYALLKSNWLHTILQHPFIYLTHKSHRLMIFLGLASLGEIDYIHSNEVDLETGKANWFVSKHVELYADSVKYELFTDEVDMPLIALKIEDFGRRYEKYFIFEGALYLLLHSIALLLSRRLRSALLLQVVSLSGISYLTLMTFAATTAQPRFLVWFCFSGWFAFLIAGAQHLSNSSGKSTSSNKLITH